MEKTRSTSVAPWQLCCSSLPHGSPTSACQLIAPPKSCTAMIYAPQYPFVLSRAFITFILLLPAVSVAQSVLANGPALPLAVKGPLLEHLDSWRRTSSSHRTFQPWADNMVYLGSTGKSRPTHSCNSVSLSSALILQLDWFCAVCFWSTTTLAEARIAGERCGGDERGERDEQ